MASACRARVLKHSDDLDPISESRDKLLLSKVLRDSSFDREPISDGEPSERANEDDVAPLFQLLHQSVYVNHNQREGVTINLAPF